MSFKDKVVIITGASSGIGAATAMKFAEQGAQLVLVARNQEKLHKIYAYLCVKHTVRIVTIIADLSKDSDVKTVVQSTIKRFGKIDVLINNAGITGSAAIWDEKALELFDQIMATNLRAVVYLTNLAAPHLIESKGNIVNMSSIAAVDVVGPEHFAYCTSKAGLDHFSRSIALDFASKGVRVNCINPGPVITHIARGYGVEDSKEFWENLTTYTALNRVSDPDEIADLVLFLASDKAKGITGSSYITDNGMLLKRMPKV